MKGETFRFKGSEIRKISVFSFGKNSQISVRKFFSVYISNFDYASPIETISILFFSRLFNFFNAFLFNMLFYLNVLCDIRIIRIKLIIRNTFSAAKLH